MKNIVTVSAAGPDKDLPGHVRLDLGCFTALISPQEAMQLAQRLLNAASIAQGIAKAVAA
jgi:hypothetical protein